MKLEVEVKALIIDDEPMACDMLAYLIRHHVPAITQVKKAGSAKEGMQLIASYQPELLFLDVQMPFMTGFDLLSAIGPHSFSVVFTTAYNKYAIKAIRFSALDYLLKPVDIEELQQAVRRHFENRQKENRVFELYSGLIKQLQHNEKQPLKLALLTAGGVRLVKPEEIIHCTGINNYTQFCLRDKSLITVSKTIKDFEELLTEHGFIRTHKSHLVNLTCVSAITKHNTLVLTNGAEVRIARRKQAEVYKALKKS